jgi:hypothetical protein
VAALYDNRDENENTNDATNTNTNDATIGTPFNGNQKPPIF